MLNKQKNSSIAMLEINTLKNAQDKGLFADSIFIQTTKRAFDPSTKTIPLPFEIKIEDCDKYPSRASYIAFLQAGCLLEMSELDLGFQMIAYWGKDRQKPVYKEQLDRNYNVINFEHIPICKT